MSSGVLEVKVEKGMLNKDVCLIGTMDPYFIAKLADGQSYKSKVRVNEGKFPQFNESFTFVANHSNNLQNTLVITVYHEDKEIGECKVFLENLLLKGGFTDEEFLLKSADHVEGKIKLRISYNPPGDGNPYSLLNQGLSDVNNSSWGSSGNTNLNTNLNSNNVLNMGGGSNNFNNVSNNQNLNRNFTYPSFDSGSIPINPNAHVIPKSESTVPNYLNKGQFKSIYEQLGIKKNVEDQFSSNVNLNQSNNSYGFNTGGLYGNTNSNTTNISNNNTGFNFNQNRNQNNFYSNLITNSLGNNTNNNSNTFNTIYQKLGVSNTNTNINNTGYSNTNTNIYGGKYPNQNNMYSNTNTNINSNTFNNNQGYTHMNINVNNNQNELPNLNQIIQDQKFESEDWYKNLTFNKNPYWFKGNSEEVYYFDLETRKWNQISNSMKCIFPANHRATELADSSFIITGGSIYGKPTKQVIQFFPVLGGFSEKEEMNRERMSHSAILNKNYLYVFGGFDSNNMPMDSVERYDLNLGGWKQVQSMRYPRAYASLLNYGEKYIFILGGFTIPEINGSLENSIIERYDIENNNYLEFKVKLKIPVYGCITALINFSVILIAGGKNVENKEYNNAYIINLSTGLMSDLNSLSKPTWSTRSAFYNKNTGCLEMFRNDEQTEELPEVLSYPVKIPFN